MKHILSLFPILACLWACAPHPEPADFVNPFIGATTQGDEAGKTFPGATTPWGMVQVSPNTITGGDNGPGYSYEHETMEGFAFTQMSGIGWYGDLGNLLVMPTRGTMHTIAGLQDGSVRGWRTRMDKSSETARAGYYSVRLPDYGILCEATAAPHSGALRFTFPQGRDSRIQIDLARRVGGCSRRQFIRLVDSLTVEGWMECPPSTGGWGNGDGKADYTVYFHAVFSKPMTTWGFWSADIDKDERIRWQDVISPEYQQKAAQATVLRGGSQMEGTHIGFFTEFATEQGEQVTMKAGISFVDAEGARRNYQEEIAHQTFDEIRTGARALWNQALGKVEVEGGTPLEDTVYYTALYHTMIDPRLCSDVDGRYKGADGNVHQTGNFQRRTIFSGWDVYRSQMPLMSLMYPGITSDLINSLVELSEESGKQYLERWELLNAYSGCMVGNPALSVIWDAYAKGIRDFDTQKAFRAAARSSAMGIDSTLLFVPGDISSTLEDAYQDWCLSNLASALGKDPEAAWYLKKSQAYRHIFDSQTGWFRQRNADGNWGEASPNRTKFGYGCVESNPYQQGWFVPHDIEGMTELMGGREKVLADLEHFFENTPEDFRWGDYYNHSNEIVHFVPFLFNRLGAPHLTQKWTRMICQKAYGNGVRGLCGNEDCGQMSAWYVLAAAGIHPVCPGDNLFEITTPLFSKVSFHTDGHYFSGRTFTVKAHNQAPGNHYIQKAELNGKPLNTPRIRWEDILSGSTLELWLGPEPSCKAFNDQSL